MKTAPPATGTIYYHEPRGLTLLTGTLVGFLVLAGFFGVALIWLDDASPGILVVSSLWWLIAAFFYGLGRSRFGADYRSLRVDSDGLWVRDRLVPAHRIGRVEVIDGSYLVVPTYMLKVRGVKLGRTQITHFPMGTDQPGVLVEDLEGGKRPGWLLASRDPEGLARALEQVRGRR